MSVVAIVAAIMVATAMMVVGAGMVVTAVAVVATVMAVGGLFLRLLDHLLLGMEGVTRFGGRAGFVLPVTARMVIVAVVAIFVHWLDL